MTLTNDELIVAVQPNAAALVCAVADHDPEEVARALEDLDVRHLHALAVLLAANVRDDSPLHAGAMSDDAVLRLCAARAAAHFNVTVDDVLSGSRDRAVTDARAVAMASSVRAGISSTETGRYFDRDHTTVLHARNRLGTDQRLRRISDRVLTTLGLPDRLIDDDTEVA